jgi:hypothetical protein
MGLLPLYRTGLVRGLLSHTNDCCESSNDDYFL